jgi:hypothetical protein
MRMKTILCMKWGTQYDADFVNQLYNGVKRNLSEPFRFICLTDDAAGFHPDIEALPLPDIELGSAPIYAGWRKISTFSPQLKDAPYNLSGDILFMDIDQIITGNLDDFFTYKPHEFCVIENWTQPGKKIGNTSVYRYNLEESHSIFKRFQEDVEGAYQAYPNSQTFTTRTVQAEKHVNFWPEKWCRSFKVHCMPPRLLRGILSPKMPKDCRILVFHGPPKPTDAAIGRWVKHNGKKRMMRPAPWVGALWHPEIN